MPFKYAIDTAKKRVVIKATGNIDADQIIDIANQHLNDPLWKTGYDVLADYSGAVHLDLSFEEAEQVSRSLIFRKADYENTRIALIMPQDLMYGSARMFEVAMGNVPVNVLTFRNESDALNWLAKEKPAQG